VNKIFILVLFLTARYLSYPQNLPEPTGHNNIGYHRFEWTDTSRLDSLSGITQKRRLIAEVWYPAEPYAGPPIPYVDASKAGLGSLIGNDAAALVLSGRVLTHAHENASFSKRMKVAPVILFSHGMGMMAQLYTAQLEDFASHGYMVVALTHPHDAWLAGFSDGTQIPLETKERSAASRTEESGIAYENTRIEVWAADIRFAIDQLSYVNREKSDEVPIAGHVDMSRIAAMGHSAGGRAAARACQLDARIKSCADQDGVVNMQPFYVDVTGIGMRQPFLLFERVRNIAPDEKDAASMGMTLVELNALVNRFRREKETALAATGGSEHVLLRFDSTNHMSFSDLPILQAKNDLQYKAAVDVLQVIRRYTREFFDVTLSGKRSTLYDGRARLKWIESVRRYAGSAD
jgi:hypothetical protein